MIESYADFCQSSKWAEIHAKANDAKPYWMEVNTNGSRKVGALFGFHASHGMFKGPANLSCLYGPVLSTASDRESLLELLKNTEKMYLDNPDLYSAIIEEIGYKSQIGTIREIFFIWSMTLLLKKMII